MAAGVKDDLRGHGVGMIRLFCGYDERESIGFSVFVHSVIARATVPVAITPLAAMGMAQGTNTFTRSRFLVPYLCGFNGWAIFMDASDMLMLADVSELGHSFNPEFAVQVVQHPDYETRHPRKYVGTEMEADNRNYPRKNWASVMLFNCEHPEWQDMTPDRVGAYPIADLLSLSFLGEDVGMLHPKWNRLVDEGQPAGKVLHWTAGIPAFEQYADTPFADQWFEERRRMEGG